MQSYLQKELEVDGLSYEKTTTHVLFHVHIYITFNLYLVKLKKIYFLNKVLLLADALEEVHHRQINVAQVENSKLSQHKNRHKNRPSFQKDLDGFSFILRYLPASACNLPRSPSVTIPSIRASSFI